jgi:hypothetical protein
MKKHSSRNTTACWKQGENSKRLVILLVLSSLLIVTVPRLDFPQKRKPARPNQSAGLPLTLEVVIKALKILGRSEMAQKNKVLVAEIRARGVDFAMSTTIEHRLRRAGASSRLLLAVRKGFSGVQPIVNSEQPGPGKTTEVNNGRAVKPNSPVPANSDPSLVPPTVDSKLNTAPIPESVFREISGKRKVLVNATGAVRDKITTRLREASWLEVVKTAKEAEIAVIYESSSYLAFKKIQTRVPSLVNAPTNAPITDLVIKAPTDEPKFDGVVFETQACGILAITIRDPKGHVPRVIWHGREDDETFASAADTLIERLISSLQMLELLLPRDFLEVEKSRVSSELNALLRNDDAWQSAQTSVPFVPQEMPARWPSSVGPEPFPTPRPEVVAKLAAKLPKNSQPVPTPAPVVRPIDQLPVYIPQPTPTPWRAPIFSAPPAPVRTTDPFSLGLEPEPLEEENLPPRLNTEGKFPEILGKQRVLVRVISPAGDTLYVDKMTARLREYGRLSIAYTAKDAEFALNFFAWNDGAKGGTLIVTIRDPAEHLPRVLWRGGIKGNDACDKLVKRFIKELKVLRNEK